MFKYNFIFLFYSQCKYKIKLLMFVYNIRFSVVDAERMGGVSGTVSISIA